MSNRTNDEAHRSRRRALTPSVRDRYYDRRSASPPASGQTTYRERDSVSRESTPMVTAPQSRESTPGEPVVWVMAPTWQWLNSTITPAAREREEENFQRRNKFRFDLHSNLRCTPVC